jgi:hypothetical protein
VAYERTTIFFSEIAKTAGSFIERSWAYLTIKNLLEKAKIDSDESAALKKQALQLALRVRIFIDYEMNCKQ